MKKSEVYKRIYKESSLDDYFDLIKKIKEESFTYSSENQNQNLFSFDGDFLVKVSFNLSNDYKSSKKGKLANVYIEKIGKNPDQESEIEKLLIKEKFKRFED